MRTIELENHAQVLKTIKDMAARGEIQGETVGLRHFRADRVDKVVENGTDRDNGSRVSDMEGDCKGGHPDGSKVTYMRTLRVDSPELSVPMFREPIQSVDGMNYLERLGPDKAQVFYSMDGIYRAAENEYWFKGDPRSSVIAICTVRERS